MAVIKLNFLCTLYSAHKLPFLPSFLSTVNFIFNKEKTPIFYCNLLGPSLSNTYIYIVKKNTPFNKSDGNINLGIIPGSQV